MSEVRRTATFGRLDFRFDPTGVTAGPGLRALFVPRLVLPSTDGLISEEGPPGTATVVAISLQIVAHGRCCQADDTESLGLVTIVLLMQENTSQTFSL